MPTIDLCSYVRSLSDDRLREVLYEDPPVIGTIDLPQLIGLDEHLVSCHECAARAESLIQRMVDERTPEEADEERRLCEQAMKKA